MKGMETALCVCENFCYSSSMQQEGGNIYAMEAFYYTYQYCQQILFSLLVLQHRYGGAGLSISCCFLYQIINGIFFLPNAPIVRRSTPAWNLRNYTPSLLHRPAADTNAYHYYFFPHIIALWNILPSSAHTSDTLRSFKHATSHLSL